MTDAERSLYNSIVHGLRSKGWSRMDAEGEALDRIDRARGMAERGLPQPEVRGRG